MCGHAQAGLPLWLCAGQKTSLFSPSTPWEPNMANAPPYWASDLPETLSLYQLVTADTNNNSVPPFVKARHGHGDAWQLRTQCSPGCTPYVYFMCVCIVQVQCVFRLHPLHRKEG